MKHKYLIGLLLLAAGLFAFNNHKATADNPRVEAATVILAIGVTYSYLPNGELERWPNGIPKEIGMHVTRISSSGNAPEIVYGENLAVACAKLMNAGLVMEPTSARPEYIFNRRPR